MSNTVRRLVIMGAAGRDFHDFLVFWKDHPNYEVVAFTAEQIPGIAERGFPKELAGPKYPDGIPIYPEAQITQIIQEQNIDVVAMSYSDLAHEDVMHKAAIVNAAGAEFTMLGHKDTMVPSNKPVIAICASRTGCGKSQTTRYVAGILKDEGKSIAAIRHPMPYGDLNLQAVQRFGELADLDKHECTIEEREEYEPHIVAGNLVFAGVDYTGILAEAEKECDVVLWDGGNNDTSFYKPDLYITVIDPHRPGHECSYYPGETNLRMADVIVVNKCDTAPAGGVDQVMASVKAVNPQATVVMANSPVSISDAEAVKGKRVLVVEDGPTLTHGGMEYGAGHVAARKFGAAEIIDPRPFAVGSIKDTYAKYDHMTEILPAMGYGQAQMDELEQTIDAADCDVVLIGTPIDLSRTLKINKPAVRVTYDLEEVEKGQLAAAIKKVL